MQLINIWKSLNGSISTLVHVLKIGFNAIIRRAFVIGLSSVNKKIDNLFILYAP